jgi:hypothetical protein
LFKHNANDRNTSSKAVPEQLTTWYFFAASARSTIDELTVWALGRHSLR